ncbi:MAG: O-antigen ligase family protein [Chloroflexota bacterium]
MSVIAFRLRRNTLQFSAFGAALMLSLMLGIAIPILSTQSLYRLVMVAVAGLSGFGLLISGQPRRILMFALLVAIPLNLAFSPLGALPPYHAGGAPDGFLIYLYDLPLLGLVVLWLLDILIHKAPIRLTAIDVVAVLFIVWSCLSLYKSTNISLSLFEVLRMIKLYLLAHIIGNLVNSKALVWTAIIGLGLAVIAQAGVTILQYVLNYDLGGLGFVVGDTHRVSGTVGWPNTLGAYIAAAMCVPLSLWLCKVGGRRRWLLLVLCLIATLPLMFTLSRGAWLGLAAGFITIVVLGFRGSWLTGKSLSKVGIIVLIAAVVGFLFSGPIAERFREPTIAVRGNLNMVAASMIASSPVLGVGLNTFVEVMPNYDSTGVFAYFPEPVHNVFLLIAAETGLVSLGLFLILLALVFRVGIQALLRGDRFLSVTVIGLLGGLTAILVSNLGDVHLKTDVVYSLFWVYIGLIQAIRRISPLSDATSSAVVAVSSERMK